MKVRTAAISDYDWIKAMAQRQKKEFGYISYGAIKDSILKQEMLIVGDGEGFCRTWYTTL